jgi:hypothetical protein
MTTTYSEVLEQTSRWPVWLISLPDRGLRMASWTVMDPIAPTILDFIDEDGIQLGASYIDPIDGVTSIGEAAAVLTDIGRRMSDAIALIGSVTGCRAIISLGWRDVPESEYRAKFSGVLSSMTPLQNHRGYNVTFRDATSLADRQVFLLATNAAPLTLTGTPKDLMLQVLTSTGTGVHGAYDTLSAENGCGLDPALWIDLAGIESEWDNWFPGAAVSFTIRNVENAREWIQRELLQPFGAHFLINASGKITIRFVRPAIIPSQTRALDDAAWIDPIIPSFTVDNRAFNQVVYRWDYDSEADQYNGGETFDYPDIRAWHGRTLTKTVESKGLRAALGAATIAKAAADRFIQTYGLLAPPVAMRSNLLGMETAVGDVLLVTTSRLPSVMAGQRKVRRSNLVDAYCLITPRYAGNPAPGTPAYLAQTVEQRVTGWSICDGATGLLPNGDPGYTVAPGRFDPITVTEDVEGIENVPVQIVSVTPDLSSGTVTMSGILLQQGANERYGLNPTAGIAEYAAQTSVQRATYWSICDGATGEMPNGDKGYRAA